MPLLTSSIAIDHATSYQIYDLQLSTAYYVAMMSKLALRLNSSYGNCGLQLLHSEPFMHCVQFCRSSITV
eukprot:scaffold92841_cov23-Cyclotella_meneghiniana.AAC.2